MLKRVKYTVINTISELKRRLSRPPKLGLCSNGKTPREVFKDRIKNRFKQKVKRMFPDMPYANKSFMELFDLPEWLDFDTWLLIQLRGRPIDAILGLSLDHLVPLNWSQNYEELLKLMSYKNTRLLDKEMNSRKSDFVDEENTELCWTLLGRAPNPEAGERFDIYETQRKAEEGDRFAKLMLRSNKTKRKPEKKHYKKGRR